MTFFLLVLIFGSVEASIVKGIPPKGLSKAWFKYLEERQSSKLYKVAYSKEVSEGRKPNIPFDLDECLSKKEFSDCDIAWCVALSKPARIAVWVRKVEQLQLKKCDDKEIIGRLKSTFTEQYKRLEKCKKTNDVDFKKNHC